MWISFPPRESFQKPSAPPPGSRCHPRRTSPFFEDPPSPDACFFHAADPSTTPLPSKLRTHWSPARSFPLLSATLCLPSFFPSFPKNSSHFIDPDEFSFGLRSSVRRILRTSPALFVFPTAPLSFFFNGASEAESPLHPGYAGPASHGLFDPPVWVWKSFFLLLAPPPRTGSCILDVCIFFDPPPNPTTGAARPFTGTLDHPGISHLPISARCGVFFSRDFPLPVLGAS